MQDARGYRAPEPEPEHLPAPEPGLPTIIQAAPPPSLQGLQRRPAVVVADAREMAEVLASVIERGKLYSEIAGRRYVRLEGWTTAGILCGQLLGDAVVPHVVFTGPVVEDGKVIGYEALVEARTASGMTLGTAKGLCLRREKKWMTADDYAISSMAQTRGAAKALRMTLGWIVTLTGFESTPAEEMDGVVGNGGPQKAAATPRPSRQKAAPTKAQSRENPPAEPADTPWATKLRDLQKDKGLTITQILDLLQVSGVGDDDPAAAFRRHIGELRVRKDWTSEQAFKDVHDRITTGLKEQDDGQTPDEWQTMVAEGEAAGEGDAGSPEPAAAAQK